MAGQTDRHYLSMGQCALESARQTPPTTPPLDTVAESSPSTTLPVLSCLAFVRSIKAIELLLINEVPGALMLLV